MLTRLGLFAWLVSLEALEAEPARQRALKAGGDLGTLAATEQLVPDHVQARGEVARLLAELEADGWVAWDWVHYASDPQPGPPPRQLFGEAELQRLENIRITPEGYAAYAAHQALLSPRSPSASMQGSPTKDADGRSVPALYDLFISHASEDKAAVVRPLARALGAMGFSVWYDEEQIEVGSSLRMSIERGLASSRYGVVVLSEAFFGKPWPQQELNGLFAREVADGSDVILPVWHEIDATYLASRAPILADRFALTTTIGIPELAERLARRLRRERGEEQLQVRSLAAPPTPPSPSTSQGGSTEHAEATASGVRTQTVAMLRADDSIGLRELLLFERRRFEAETMAILRDAGDTLGSSADPDRLKPIESALWAQIDRRLGSLLPLVEYRPGALEEELQAAAAFAERPIPTRAPFSAWLDGARWPVWNLVLIVGSLAVALGRFEVVRTLWQIRQAGDRERPLPAMRLRGGSELGAALTRARAGKQIIDFALWYPAFAVAGSELVQRYYPELLRGGDTSDPVLGFLSRAGDYTWLSGALAGRDNVDMIRHWEAPQVHPTLRDVLGRGAVLRRALGAAIDVEEDRVLAHLDEWHSKV